MEGCDQPRFAGERIRAAEQRPIVRELRKAFRGRTAYKWSDDGSLFAVWERD
jgi:hypothetical protein